MERGNAVRAVQQTTMRLDAPPEEVFGLLCPVREHEWLPGWQARLVFSESGVAEAGCVFTTAQADGSERVWTVCRYEPPRAIAFVVVTPGSHVTTLEVRLEGEHGGERTLAAWTYVLTSLSPAGDAFIAGDSPAHAERMRVLEAMLARFLAHGAARTDSASL